MASQTWLWLTIALIVMTCEVCASSDTGKKKHSRFFKMQKAPEANKPAAPKLNTENLPKLEEILESVGLGHRIKNFYGQGVHETRQLLRMKRMDFNMLDMEIDEDDRVDGEFIKLQELIPELIARATVTVEPPKPEYEERNKLRNGRVYSPTFVQSFEYALASFGSPPPVGTLDAYFPEDDYGCSFGESGITLTNQVVVVKRGSCTFLEKAVQAHKANASVLLIVNNEDRLESPSSGLFIEKNITEQMVKSVSALSVIATSNISLAPLSRAWSDWKSGVSKHSVQLAVVPIKCGKGGACSAVTQEDKLAQKEISCGDIKITRSVDNIHSKVDVYDFLSSNFGGALPFERSITVSVSIPRDACEELQTNLMPGYVPGGAILVIRGGCKFGVKALNIQNAGGGLVIIADETDPALQRPGGLHPVAGYVGIPSVMVSWLAAESIIRAVSENGTCVQEAAEIACNTRELITAELVPSKDSNKVNDWIDLAHTEFSDSPDLKITQIEGLVEKYSGKDDILRWLRRQRDSAAREFLGKLKRNK